jgi:AraC-like DNA-binding protein
MYVQFMEPEQNGYRVAYNLWQRHAGFLRLSVLVLYVIMLCLVVRAAKTQESDTIENNLQKTHRLINSPDSAVIISPVAATIIGAAPVRFEIKPVCKVLHADLFVTTYPGVTETLSCGSVPPFSAVWNPSGYQDQDQISMHFGYRLIHESGDTIVTSPLVHRWCLAKKVRTSGKIVRVREMFPADRIKIDGDSHDWNGMRREKINNRASFACTWTPQAVYLHVKVNDRQVTAKDRVEVCFDLYSTRTVMADSAHRMISFSPVGRIVCIAVNPKSKTWPGINDIMVRMSEETIWRTENGNGWYAIEAMIPFGILGNCIFPPGHFGFDISVIDETPQHGPMRSIVSWSGAEPSARFRPASWGKMVLRQALFPLKLTLSLLVYAVLAVVAGVSGLLIAGKRRELKNAGLGKSPKHILANRAADLIYSQCVNPRLAINDIAGMMKTSPEELGQVFEQCLQGSFEACVAAGRVSMAKSLLRDPDILFAEIGTRSGFLSPEEFKKTFTALAGTSPEKYRESRIAEQEEGE